MNTIERATQHIGLIEHESMDRQGSDATSETPQGKSLIERAVDDSDKHPRILGSDEIGRAKSGRAGDARNNLEQEPVDFLEATPSRSGARKKFTDEDVDETRSVLYRIDRQRLSRLRMVQPDGTRTPVSECIRLIKSQLLSNISKNRSDLPKNLIMVTSSVPGEGKTFVATNLAISMAMEMDHRVLLVDADVAKPSIPGMLGFSAGQGLMDVLGHGMDLAQVICKTDIGKLSVLPAGTIHQHATELLSSDAMRALAQELARHFEDRVVIFDSPPLLAASEAGALARHMGQIVFVVEAGKTSERELMDALERIDSGKVAGAMLNKGLGSHRRYGYGYGSPD